MSSLSLLLLWFHVALSRDQWRLVHPDGSVQAAWGTPQLTASQRSEVVSAWVWSSLRAPRRVAPAQIGRERFSDDVGRLAVRVTRRSGGKPPADLRLLAAPLEMWREVPEAALPSWPVPEGGRLSIPLDSGRLWRLRVAGRDEGSWWVTVRPGERTAVLTSTPAAGIEVAVLDPEGRPVRNLNGSLQEPMSRGGKVGAWATQHGEAGTLAVPGLPDDGEVSLTLMTGGAAPLVLRGRPSALPHQVRLAAGAELIGRLVDDKGTPVGGVPVEAEAWSSGELPQIVTVKGRSGPDGAWHLRGLPAGKVAWSARARGSMPLMETVEVQEGERKDLGARTLAPGSTLVVQVMDDAGDPVSGAQVHVDAGRLMALADAHGVAQIEGLPAAPVEVKGSADGYLGGSARFNVPFPREARLVLPRAFVILGRFVDASGSPILRGSARLDSASCQREAVLQEGGRFRFDLPPLSGSAELVLGSPATQELRLRLAPGQAGETRDLGDLEASRGLTVTGRVVRADDGSPVAGAHIWTTRQGSEGPAVAWAAHDVLDAVAGEDGRFEVSGLVAAPALLRVEAAALARTQLTVPLDQPGDRDGESGDFDLGTIALSAGATLHVRVDAREQDFQGAVARADLGNRWLEPDMLTAQVWNGEAVLPNVPAGKVTLSVLAGRRLLCERAVVVPEGGNQQVDCGRRDFLVSGVVQVGGAPVSTGTLSWSAPDLAMPSRIDTVVSPAGLKQYQVVGAGRPGVSVAIAADGRFETQELTPGRWRVTWLSQGSASSELVIDIPAGERFETVLSFPGLAITGTVVDRDGRPAEGARVRELTNGAIAFTDAEGSFSLAGLKPGKAVVQAQLLEQTSPALELALREDQPQEPLHLTLGDRKAPALSVQVVDKTNAPVASAFVFLEEEGKGQRLVVANAAGKAAIMLDPPLPSRVRAAAYAAGAWGFGAWSDRETASQGLIVEIAGAGSLVVTSARQRGSPHILTQDGWDVAWLLRLLGVPPVLSPEQPLRVDGLVSGQYRISLDGASRTVAVTEEHPAAERFE